MVANQDKAQLGGTADTDALVIGVVARGTDTLLSLIEDEAAARWTGGHRGALHSSIALVSLDTDADHGPHGQGVQHRTLGIETTGVRQVAGVGALLVDTRGLAGTLGV